jgi:glutathione synthase/RimK-type ligase-like ATP-grasp enzyme
MDEKRKLKRIIKEKGARGNSEYEQKLHLELKEGNDNAADVVLMRLASEQDKEVLISRYRMSRLVESLGLAVERCDFSDWTRNMDKLKAERRILKEKLSEWLKANRV